MVVYYLPNVQTLLLWNDFATVEDNVKIGFECTSDFIILKPQNWCPTAEIIESFFLQSHRLIHDPRLIFVCVNAS